jgi:hypothetical protein
MRNEADTRATLIEPKLKAAGWTDTQITREYYYQRDVQYTPGRIILEGNRVRRGKARKVDYLLRLTDAFPIAVVEAKAEFEPAEAGLEQAKRYARDLGFPPLTEQRRIVAHLEAVQEKLRALQAAQAETEEQLKHLEQSILDKAFRGEL